MISYKDKLLFLAFKKIMTFYLHFIETELNEESLSLELSKSNISTKLSTQDQKYACLLYDDMLFHNNQFKHLIKKLDSEISAVMVAAAIPARGIS